MNKPRGAFPAGYKFRKDPQKMKPVVKDSEGPGFPQDPPLFILDLTIERLADGKFSACILNLDRCERSRPVRVLLPTRGKGITPHLHRHSLQFIPQVPGDLLYIQLFGRAFVVEENRIYPDGFHFRFSSAISAATSPDKSIAPKVGPIRGNPYTVETAMPVTIRPGCTSPVCSMIRSSDRSTHIAP